MNKILIVALMILCCTSTYASGVNHAVLVAAAGTPVEKFTNKELRLLYLGYPVTRGKRRFEPLINQSGEITYQGFLQKVMFMSKQSYNRKLVTRVFRHGGERPPSFQQRGPLIIELKKNTNAITFMMPEVAAGIEGIQVVQPLW
ncbi:MAG: hypothetical protein ACC650_09155 [Gammaproteobacteria bacterium]